jgi:hypothetical protein
MVPDARMPSRTLVILDRSLSTLLGRPCALQGEESAILSSTDFRTLSIYSFDADLPLICNDEELDESGLKLPLQQGRPTQISGFVCMIKLSQILAFTLRTLVSRPRCQVSHCLHCA